MSSLSAPLQAVVDLFSGPLQGVRFAEIDGEGLSSLATEVETLSNEVEALEAQLASYREALAQKQEALGTLAQQALAYARIYAENDETLAAELEEISLPRAGKPRKNTAPKTPSERGAKAPKDAADSSVDVNEAEVPEPEPVASPSKVGRKSAASVIEPEAEEEAPPPAKVGRKKAPTRRAR